MKKTAILVTRKLPAPIEARMAKLFAVTFNRTDHPMTAEEIVKKSDGVTVLVPTVTDAINKTLLQALPDCVKMIANFGVGFNHIDLSVAKTRGIIVTNTPDVLTEDTADLTLALMIAVPRRISEGERVLRSGDWNGWEPTFMLGKRFSGKTLGIIGLGRIGRAVARRAAGFGLKIHYHNRNRLPKRLEEELGVIWRGGLNQMLAEIDFLSIHCPLTADTENLINGERMDQLQPHAVIINTARGGILDEDALIDRLKSGHLAGAGLDVYSDEPKINPKLLSLPNVMTLPHLGSATDEGRIAMGQRVIDNILSFLKLGVPGDLIENI
ncbi:MAG: D-glycerate dehydrogenase [Rhodospirillaceae bacterium]